MTIAPFLRRSPYYARRPSLLDGPREEALRMVLRTMTRRVVEFDVDMEVQGRELLRDGPLIVVSGHFLLNIGISRVLYDNGRSMTAALGLPREPIYYLGTKVRVPFRYSGPQMFLQLRKILGENGVCFITVEQPIPHEEWMEVETVAGKRYVSPATFAFAARTGTPLVFSAVHLDRERRLSLTIEQPRSRKPEAMAAEFCEFLRKHAAAIAR